MVGSASDQSRSLAGAYCAQGSGPMLVRVAALELKPESIRVNHAPAGVVTPMWRGGPFWEELVRRHGSKGAWKVSWRCGPGYTIHSADEEIAEAIVFLSCDQSAHGSAIDGGYIGNVAVGLVKRADRPLP